MSSLFILAGLPFSGKSTFAKKVEDSTSIKRVSFDDLWVSFAAVDPNISYDTIIGEIKKLMSKQLEKGFSVIYDSTNLKEEHRKEMLDVAFENDAEAVVIYFSISIEEMRKRQAKSMIDKTHHEVGEDNIQKALEHNTIPSHCVIIESEEDKEKLMKEMIQHFPNE